RSQSVLFLYLARLRPCFLSSCSSWFSCSSLRDCLGGFLDDNFGPSGTCGCCTSFHAICAGLSVRTSDPHSHTDFVFCVPQLVLEYSRRIYRTTIIRTRSVLSAHILPPCCCFNLV